MSFLDYFLDPVLRGPTVGSMLMCFSASVVGVIVVLRKQSLLGEAISHTAYPGVILAAALGGFLGFNGGDNPFLATLVIVLAFFTGLLGVFSITFLEQTFRIRPDSALCFVLATFFGVGLTLASQIQFSYTSLYKQSLTYLYGQAATLRDFHIFLYGGLALFVILIVVIFFKEIEVISFDRSYAKSVGIPVRALETFLFSLIVFAVVIGIRSVGVVLMSGMLIAPAAAARQFTPKLQTVFVISGLIGLVSGFFGNYFSVQFNIATGPSIILVASALCISSLFFAPERGVFFRVFRAAKFRFRCLEENLLKAIWRKDQPISFESMRKVHKGSTLYLQLILWRLRRNGWIVREGKGWKLTSQGSRWAEKIIRLHRLWEVYLADFLGVGVEKVHKNAEEMEHIITPHLEKELTLLLDNPTKDPHDSPIPPPTLHLEEG